MRGHLVERAQAGDRAAYEQLARAVAPRLSLVASRILRDGDAADDAVQQTLVWIWRDIRTLRDPERFDAWTYRIIVRACRTEARRRRTGPIPILAVPDLPSPADHFGRVALDDLLKTAFDSLSLDHRTVVVLHYLVGLPLAEIAEILDVPFGTVGSRLHHALRAMRAAIEAADRTPVPGGLPV